MIVINALLSYLVDAGYLRGNPLSLIRRRNRTLKPETREAISQERFLALTLTQIDPLTLTQIDPPRYLP